MTVRSAEKFPGLGAEDQALGSPAEQIRGRGTASGQERPPLVSGACRFVGICRFVSQVSPDICAFGFRHLCLSAPGVLALLPSNSLSLYRYTKNRGMETAYTDKTTRTRNHGATTRQHTVGPDEPTRLPPARSTFQPWA